MSDLRYYDQGDDDTDDVDVDDISDAELDALLEAPDVEEFDEQQAYAHATHFIQTKLGGRRLTADEQHGLAIQLEAQWNRGEQFNAEQAFNDHWKYAGRDPYDITKREGRNEYMVQLAREADDDHISTVFGRDWSGAEPPDLETREGHVKYMVERVQGRPKWDDEEPQAEEPS